MEGRALVDAVQAERKVGGRGRGFEGPGVRRGDNGGGEAGYGLGTASQGREAWQLVRAHDVRTDSGR